MKALIIEAAPGMGGSFTSIELVIRHGIQIGWAFDVMSAFSLEGYLPETVKTMKLPLEDSHSGQFEQLLVVLELLRSEEYDVLLLNNVMEANFPALIAGVLSRTPILQFVRGFERDCRMWQTLSPFVDGFVAVSQAIRRHLISIGAPSEKIILAPEGISIRPCRETTQLRAHGLPEDARVMCFLGRLVPWKGPDLFVRAAIQSLQEHPDLHAVLIGSAPDGDYLATLKALVRDSPWEERVHFLGAVQPLDVYPLLKECDLMLHTSVTPEPFGRVLLESMSVGTPVLSSSFGGPEEILTHRVDGMLCPGADASMLAKEVAWYFSDPEHADILSKQARTTLEERFSEEVCVMPVLNWLNENIPGINRHHKTKSLLHMLPIRSLRDICFR